MNRPKLRIHVPGAATTAPPLLDPPLTEDEAMLIRVQRGLELSLALACEYLAAGACGRMEPIPTTASVPFRPKGGAS